MEKELDFEEIVLYNNLEIIETTDAHNGYPQHLRKAIVGFGTFEEAPKLANEYGLRITTFFMRDGWQLWVRNSNTTYHPLHNTSSDYGDDYNHHYCSDRIRFFEEKVKPCLDNFESLNELEAFIRDKRKLYDKLDDIDDSQIVISYQGDILRPLI